MSKIRIAALITAVVGLADSVYLSWAKLSHSDILCIQSDVTNCDLVNSSSYSQWQGIPVAILGVLGYLVIIVLLIVNSTQAKLADITSLAFTAVTTFGLIYSCYLTYVEVFILKALCQWCLVSALAMTILWIISVILVRRNKIITNLF